MRTYRIPELAKKYVDYDMITTHTELPPLANARVRLLYTFLIGQEGFSEAEAENIALAVYLVQLGMDTHDLIDAEPIRKEEGLMRSRQLNVLAGDYFSSLFYELLAGAGRIELISELSSSVCEVNRKKVNLYTKLAQSDLSSEVIFNSQVELNKELYLPISSLIDSAHQHVWLKLLHEVSCCEIAVVHLNNAAVSSVAVGGPSLVNVKHTHDLGNRLLTGQEHYDWVTDVLRQSLERIQQLLSDVQSERLREELRELIQPFVSKLRLLKPVL
ncbi:heptaprenyl diphosphate synthase component 1 [Paenibacillus sp. YPG26]|uniref:heptaprenyl diphosphate synthase component 1 n=1 Tax=Paenibacillus sp. YPG26 TaxID=2878915 RepID=UPI00203B9399|nr:heptaprenyl diphosphate synthase component 1 [Paenibacillus sp. YPG26]USB34762.1 heptaprenyl diphosphate synthase component 1 [Paenibacillus sp. YPG26]